MQGSFLFDNYDTWADWGLIITKKDTTPPEPKTNHIEIPGMSGVLDLSESLAGEITYKNRIVSATFWTRTDTRDAREVLIRRITAALHGKKMKIIDPDDTDHYFFGRVAVKKVQNLHSHSVIEIEANCDPWRYATREKDITVDSNYTFKNNGVKTVCPDLCVTGSVTFTCNGVTTQATNGHYKIATFKLFPGDNYVEISGGTLQVIYREAIL